MVVTGTNGSIKVTKAEIVLAEVELQPVGAQAGCDGSDADGCDHIEAGPFLVDLPLAPGSVTRQFTVTVPKGRYRAFEAEINGLKPGKPSTNAFFAKNSAWPAGTSVRVTGEYTPSGSTTPKSFTYLSALEAEIESAFTSPINVADGGTANITLDIDVASWFKSSAAGPVLDPTVTANSATIDANIKRSLRAFEDNGQVGVEDRR
ncbi:MAG: hypothetical protein NVS1B4_26130 [Gemmatimonadaceae bacterium]